MQRDNLIGQNFGKLTVISRAGSSAHQKRTWLCLCDCGKQIVVDGGHLKSGHTKSCSCLQKQKIGDLRRTHGHSMRTPEYRAWAAMKDRCGNPNNPAYKNYGGRGIKVCQRWIESFENFLTDMGLRPSPGLTLERIKNDDGYEPSSCKWATRIEQANNTRRTKHKI
jgi:hypothetical protein